MKFLLVMMILFLFGCNEDYKQCSQACGNNRFQVIYSEDEPNSGNHCYCKTDRGWEHPHIDLIDPSSHFYINGEEIGK